MFNPAWLRKILCEFFLRHMNNLSIMAEKDGTRARRALIQCKNIFSHTLLLAKNWHYLLIIVIQKQEFCLSRLSRYLFIFLIKFEKDYADCQPSPACRKSSYNIAWIMDTKIDSA